MRLSELAEKRTDNQWAIKKLREHKLLLTSVNCGGCENILKEVKNSRTVDGRSFICYKKQCKNFNKKISIRIGSFLSKYRMPLGNILICIYYLFDEKSQKSLLWDFKFKKTTVQRLWAEVRYIIGTKMDAKKDWNFGSGGSICQIDESMFHYKTKNNLGRRTEKGRLVLGIVNTVSSPARYYVEVVPNRKKETLLKIIEKICVKGAKIHTDMWKGYSNLSENFVHETVNHKFNFVNPKTKVHSQHVESLWNKLKKRLKILMGVGNNDLSVLLKFWMWKDNFSQNLFENLIKFLAYWFFKKYVF